MTLAIWTGTTAAPPDRAAGWTARPGAGSWLDRVLADWYAVADRHVRSTPLARADLAVLPWSLEAPWEVAGAEGLQAEAERFVRQARDAGLVTVAFCRSDAMHAAPPGCVVLRTSVTRPGPLDVAAPPWVADPAGLVPLDPRPLRRPPSVAFVGQARPLGAGAVAHARYAARVAATATGVADRIGRPAAYPHRPWGVGWVRRSRAVDPQVVVRDEIVRPDFAAPDDGDFLRAITDADYGLAVRGFGNYSFRLYEVLACGRPALLLESGAPLPRAGAVDWDRLVVRHPWLAAPSAGRALARRHAELDADAWARLQDDCRQAWLDHLSPRGFLATTAAALEALGPAVHDPAAVAAALR